MVPEAREVHLSRKARKVVEACCHSQVTLQRDLKRPRMVLLAADRRSTRSIAKEVGSSRGLSAFGDTAMPIMALKPAGQAAARQAGDLYEGHRQPEY